ncbi:hypothetical protein H4Q26_000393 [Puccinia striiformis f. sp. tritici PST-130]|nr:hypothetical protein H4Q26_000393 [Puccinia striiformis f. sp. tritici PST-130]
MEKFSTWRDPSTGLAPFVYPLPPLSTFQLPRITWILLLPLALFRTLALILLALLFLSSRAWFGWFQSFRSNFIRLFNFIGHPLSPEYLFTYSGSFNYLETLHSVIELHLKNSSLIPQAGYNPIFILPVLKDEDNDVKTNEAIIEGFEIKTLLEMIARSGHPPTTTKSKTTKPKTLMDCILESKRSNQPLIVFPEGTTSNNRALLKPAKLTEKSLGKQVRGGVGKVRVFCLAIKHETPTVFKNSITIPIPTPLNLPHIIQANVIPTILPFPIFLNRSIIVKFPKNNFIEFNSDSSQLRESLDSSFDSISQISKLKITNQINSTHKIGFLNYARSRKS